MCAGLCPTYWTTFGIAERNRNGSCPQHEWDHPQFFEFLTPPPPVPQGPMGTTEGGGTSADIFPTRVIIWCGSVQALLRYRSKTAKMQKFFIDSHSNENFICLFFRPPGAANPQTTSFPFLVFALPWAKISRRSHHPALRYPQPYKQTKKTKKQT